LWVVIQGIDHAHGHVQGVFEFPRLGSELTAGRPCGVHVVQQKHARHPQLPNLQHQEELTLERQGIRDEHDEVGAVGVCGVQECAFGDATIVGLGMQVVQARKVVNHPAFAPWMATRPYSRIHSDTRQVAD
jgi:hypothetical protein